jgi:glutamate-ammonia-ligase adenylyltransferase
MPARLAPRPHRAATVVDLDQALAYSRYAERALTREPGLREWLAVAADRAFDWRAAQADVATAQAAGGAALAVALRVLRRRVFLHTLARDLTGRATLDEVVRAMSALADLALRASVQCHSAEMAALHGTPRNAQGEPQELIVVGMGKLGGEELNVSSDVDLVLVYPEDGITDGARPVENGEFFERLGRRVIATLDKRTDDGYVFRVDMRLRPYGESGALVASFARLEQYLVTQGRAWERYAWLKARPVTGGRHAELMDLVEPFVYRKYLDYDAYEGLRGIHRQIRAQERREDYGRDVKLGRGGIREVEFVVQALQIVRGGREPTLRARGTRSALAALETRGLIAPAAAAELGEAYAFLRDVEHRLQYRDDEQTQRVPTDRAEVIALAAALGLPDATALETRLAGQRAAVEAQFEAVFGTSDAPDAASVYVTAWEEPEAADTATLRAAGFDDPRALLARLRETRAASRYLQLPAPSRQRFDELVPALLAVAATERVSGATRQEVFLRLLGLLEAVSRRSAYLALLREHPPLLPRLAQLMGASAWAADYLTQHPALLDELLDARVLFAEPDWGAWRAELARLMAMHAGNPEQQMDELRHFRHAQSLRLLAQDLAGRLTVERLADHLSALADAIVEATVRECWRQLCEARGLHWTEPAFAVIAYGRLGGKELGYASDLDLVFLYDVAEDASDGAAERYTRLAHRVNMWLSTTTAAGQLYDTDLRLRPDGEKGLMVTSFAGFVRYQREHAWTWEHQALTRARFAAGDAALGARFEAERDAILQLARDPARLAADIVAMRQRMAAGHPNRSNDFDLKHDEGGMVDIEFIVQYLVLAHAHAHPALTANLGNIALLRMAGERNLVPAPLADASADAYREFRRLQHRVRLTGAKHARVDPAAEEPRRAAVRALWLAVFGARWPVSAQPAAGIG